MLRIIFGKRIGEAKRKYAAEGLQTVEAEANLFGVESRGMAQVRGNGALLLTNSSLVFAMFRPAQDLVIPLSKISKVESVETHLGKSVSRPLLKVHFTNEEGNRDSAAWWVANVTEWRNLLEKGLRQHWA